MNWLKSVANRYRVSEDPLRTLRRMEMLALLLGLLLCVQLAWGGFRLATMAPPEPVPPAADSLQVPAVLTHGVVSAEERNEIINRPLFWSSRRPVEAVAKVEELQPGQAGELKGVKLFGLFGSGDQAGVIALVKGQKRRILLGEEVDGWTISSITPTALVVSNGERTETLVLQPVPVPAAPGSTSADGPRPGQVQAYPQAHPPPASAVQSRKRERDRQRPVPAQAPPPQVSEGDDKSGEKPAQERTLGFGPRG